MARMKHQHEYSVSSITTDDGDDDNHNHGINRRYLPSTKYRHVATNPISNIGPDQTSFVDKRSIDDDLHSLTDTIKHAITTSSSQYSLNTSSTSSITINDNYRSQPWPSTSIKRLHNPCPIVIGQFILMKKSDEKNSLYNYRPKHTKLPLVYQGLVTGSTMRQRAFNQITDHAIKSGHLPSSFAHQYVETPSTVSFRTRSTMDPSSPLHKRSTNLVDQRTQQHGKSLMSLDRKPTRKHRWCSTMRLSHTNETQDRYYFGESIDDIVNDNEQFAVELPFSQDRVSPEITESSPLTRSYLFQELVDAETITDSTLFEQKRFSTVSTNNHYQVHHKDDELPTRQVPIAASIEGSSNEARTSSHLTSLSSNSDVPPLPVSFVPYALPDSICQPADRAAWQPLDQLTSSKSTRSKQSFSLWRWLFRKRKVK
jgi:hypothetical protein